MLRGAYALLSEPDDTDVDAVDDPPVDPAFPFKLLDPASPTALARHDVVLARGVGGRPGAVGRRSAGSTRSRPTSRPLIDETPVSGLYVNTGYSGHGVMCSIGGARHLVEVITGAERDNPFALDRVFAQPRSGLH